jgi:hypothetical protein
MKNHSTTTTTMMMSTTRTIVTTVTMLLSRSSPGRGRRASATATKKPAEGVAPRTSAAARPSPSRHRRY